MADKTLIVLTIGGSVLFSLLAISIVYILMLQKARQNAHRLEKRQLLYELQNKELSLLFEEREMMKREVSKEVHDNFGQITHFIRMSLHLVRRRATDDVQLKIIDDICVHTDKLIYDMKHLSHTMNPEFIKKSGLIGSLESDLNHIRSAENIKCFFDRKGSQNVLSPEKQLLVYRIAQQAIQNILQHAEATVLEITIVFDTPRILMQIKDNGKGFKVEEGMKKGGLGLANMKQRARHLNGGLDIQSEESVGTTITLRFVNS